MLSQTSSHTQSLCCYRLGTASYTL
jgi:hypothetical protein